MRQLLFKEKRDTSRVLLLCRLAGTYLYSKPDTALLICGEALELSQAKNFKKGEMVALSSIGTVFNVTGNYPRALEAFLQGLKIAEEEQNDVQRGNILSSLADVYFYQGDLKRSVQYSHQALSLKEKLHDSTGMRTALINLGDSYEKSNELDSALVYTRLGYGMSISQSDLGNKSVGSTNMGNIFLKQGKLDSAMIFYRSALLLFQQTNNQPGTCETFLGMAKIFLQQNKADSCLYYAKLSFNKAKDGGFTDQVLAASSFLADYYKTTRIVDSAYVYQSATIVAKDSLFSQQKATQIQSMTYDESLRRQQIERAKEQERIRFKQNALMAGLAALLVVAFLLYINNRQKRKSNLLLQKQKHEIDHKAHELSVQKDNLEQSYNNVELLGKIGRKITSCISVEKIIATAYDNVNALMDASVFGIGIYNDDLKRIEFPATYENGEALPFYTNAIDDKNRFGPLCFNSGKEIVIGDLYKEYKDHIQEVVKPHEGAQPVSIIFLPLTAKEKKLGVITVQSFQRNVYTDYHLYMLRNIAIYTAIAIENAESYEELNQTITSLQSTQAQLVQSEKMASLGELTAGIAHEIQNPLNFVNNFSEVNMELFDEMQQEIKNGNSTDALEISNDIKQNLQKIAHHGKRADSIVKSMLQHSRKSTGQKEATDINALVDEFLRLSYHGLRAKDKNFNAIIETHFDATVNKISVIPQDIGRVLLNLFNNAFYAVSEKKRRIEDGYEPAVQVTTKQNNSRVEIRVKDNGIGIPQKALEKIYQPFFTTKPTGEGTGLGLSLSYDIITKAHGGEIKASTVENEGTVFTILLPLGITERIDANH